MKKNNMSVAAVLSLAFLARSVMAINPGMQRIYDAFPSVPTTTVILVGTLPSLISIPSSLLSGAFAGNRLRWRTIAVLGLFMYAFGGVAPVFLHDDLSLILIFRAIFGFGEGMLSPMTASLITSAFSGDKRASMLGYASVVTNFGGIAFQLLCGALSRLAWQLVFLPYAIGVIPLVLCMFYLPEPVTTRVVGSDGSPCRITRDVWISALAVGLAMFAMYPSTFAVPFLLKQRDMGGSAMAGFVLSVNTLGGVVGGMTLGDVYRRTGRFSPSLYAFLMAGGIALQVFSTNLFTLCLGSALTGFSFSSIMPLGVMKIGGAVDACTVPLGVCILQIMIDVFQFLSGPLIGFVGSVTGDGVVAPMKVGMAISILAGLGMLFARPIDDVKRNSGSFGVFISLGTHRRL